MPAIGAEIIIDGIGELVDLYSASDSIAEALLEDGMSRSLEYADKNVQFPPSETIANQPPPPYYIRTVGTQYLSYNRGESENLTTTWDSVISKEDKGLIGTISPTATYAPYVHGNISQIGTHRNTGWRKVSQIAEGITEVVQDIFAEQARKLAAYLSGGK